MVREGIAETSITICYCRALYSLLLYCAWGCCIVLSVGMNRNWYAASDWLAGHVVCEV